MIMRIHIDVSYLSEPKALRRVGGLFFVGSQKFKKTREKTALYKQYQTQ